MKELLKQVYYFFLCWLLIIASLSAWVMIPYLDLKALVSSSLVFKLASKVCKIWAI